ncbi:MAG: hypothetical protein RMJ30_07920, partial [Nitrososphaerota archaeon]|nr:hypothetical protein [Nitrososphaerota archaeon]
SHSHEKRHENSFLYLANTRLREEPTGKHSPLLESNEAGSLTCNNHISRPAYRLLETMVSAMTFIGKVGGLNAVSLHALHLEEYASGS